MLVVLHRAGATDILELAPQTGPGLIAKQDVVLKGNYVRLDSFDSSEPAHDDPLDANEIKAGGGVASFAGNISIGHGAVHGRIFTGTNGTFSLGALGSVGPLDWTGLGLYSPDWQVSNYEFSLVDVTAPFFPASFTPTGSGTNYWVLLNGDYLVNGNVDLNHQVILVAGHARLHITGNFHLRGSSELKILPGAALRLYVGTGTGPESATSFAKISNAGSAASFIIYGLPSNKSIAWDGEGSFSGAIYAPQATMLLGGGGADVRHFIGACVVNEAVLSGRLHFHGDEALMRQ